MSFILDALRKSEHERQRNRAPSIADMQVPQKKSRRSLWLPLVALLAGLNLALLAMLWFVGNRAENETTPVAQTPITRAPAQQMPAPATADNRNLSAELPAPPADKPARFASISPPSPKPSASTDMTAAADSRMLTVTEAMLDGSLSIPPLRLELHVYDSDPANRLVFINTSRYAEGERISEGPTVSAINEQGVILNYQGRDYLLSRE